MMLRTLMVPFNMEFFMIVMLATIFVDASKKEKPIQLLRTMATAGLIREYQLEDRADWKTLEDGKLDNWKTLCTKCWVPSVGTTVEESNVHTLEECKKECIKKDTCKLVSFGDRECELLSGDSGQRYSGDGYPNYYEKPTLLQPYCVDGEQNHDETGIDCGGNCGICEATCVDGITNQDETGVDCGGICDPCYRCNVYVGVENQVAVDEGKGVASTEEVSVEGCKQSCAETSGCKSFAFCPRNSGCYMKDKILDGTEATAESVHLCTTYYPKCGSAVNCVWDEFGPWSSCSATCDGGTRTRTREEAIPASNGGGSCIGSTTETGTCNTHACPDNCIDDDKYWFIDEFGASEKTYNVNVKKDTINGIEKAKDLGCGDYRGLKLHRCGAYDNSLFTANSMCCACMGGKTESCAPKDKRSACHKIVDRFNCLTTLESRRLELETNVGEIKINGSPCSWCPNGCSGANTNKCEPSIWLKAKSLSGDESIERCYPNEWIERSLVQDEGEGIIGIDGKPLEIFSYQRGGKTLQKCKIWCDETYGCNSVAWQPPGNCHLKKKCLNENDPSKSVGEYKSYYKPCVPEYKLVAEKKECGGSEIKKGTLFNADACATACKGEASMFAFGTNDFGKTRCDKNGCKCLCETSATSQGACEHTDHDGYRLYKYSNDWIERDLVMNEGVHIDGGAKGRITLAECKRKCDETIGCNSIRWHSNQLIKACNHDTRVCNGEEWALGAGCYLKKKCLTDTEPSKTNALSIHAEFKSYYRPCDWIERTLVTVEGKHIDGANTGYTLEKCKLWCDQTDGCKSFVWREKDGSKSLFGGSCWLKEKCLTRDDPGKTHGKYKSYYKPCRGRTARTTTAWTPNQAAPTGIWKPGTTAADVDYILLKSDHECKSQDKDLGDFTSLEECKDACRNMAGCNFFIFGKDAKQGNCYWEKTSDSSCTEGWEKDKYDFYELPTYFESLETYCEPYEDKLSKNWGSVSEAKQKCSEAKDCNMFFKETYTRPIRRHKFYYCPSTGTKHYSAGGNILYAPRTCINKILDLDVEDEDSKCDSWKTSGFCTHTWNMYMHQNCRKSCRFCA